MKRDEPIPKKTVMRIYQDGREFYADESGEVIFKSSYIVKDFNLEAAGYAREEFELFFAREYPNHSIEWID